MAGVAGRGGGDGLQRHGHRTGCGGRGDRGVLWPANDSLRCRDHRPAVAADGAVVTPLDEAHLVETARTLVEGHGVEVFVVCFLHSYVNPAHERRAREVLNTVYPKIPVTLSSDVLPRKREYRRLVASGFDGYVKPIVTDYLRALESALHAEGIAAPLHIMLSHGGVAGLENVTERPVRTVLSGLAAGVIGNVFHRIDAFNLFDDRGLHTIEHGHATH